MKTTSEDPCKEFCQILKNRTSNFSLKMVSQELVLKTAKRMKKTSSMGNDDIPADLFQAALPFMLPAITHICNLSLKQAKFPARRKVSKLAPLHKSGEN